MSEVTICNLALSHLGDTAEVTSIKPPDGSVQAQLCARFYWAARNALLEMASWGFATQRVALTAVANPTVNSWTDEDGSTQTGTGSWRFAYAMPDETVNVLAVLPVDAIDDYEARFCSGEGILDGNYWQRSQSNLGADKYVPHPFVCETAADGSQIILTNVPDAVLRYTTVVEDTTKFSPLFTLALSYLLASMLAGPLIKGDAGVAAAEQMLQLFGSFKNQAIESDANQRKVRLEPVVSWIRGR
ncbi:MAG: hypothetical protein WB424_07500 [Terracidiphilus sp.]